MKTILQFLFIQLACFAAEAQPDLIAQHSGRNVWPASELRSVVHADALQNHYLAPEVILYSWDTVSTSWVYLKTLYPSYGIDSGIISAYTYDTIANLPIQFDTMGFDTLGRLLFYQIQTWNGGWQNVFRLEHTYWDTNSFNAVTKHFSGSGNTWTLSFADSSYGTVDANGNLIDNYYDYFDITASQFKPTTHTLTDFDLQNRVERRRTFQYDTLSAQYKIQVLDSNIVYDAVYTILMDDIISYTYSSGAPVPNFRTKQTFTGTTDLDRIELDQTFNLISWSWDNYLRINYTGQSCNNPDSSLEDRWDNVSGWQPESGTRDIFNFIGGCDYDEHIIQDYAPWLGTYRNFIKYVYPANSTTNIQQIASHSEIVISPNPFHNTAKVNSQFTMHNSQLRICNSLGTLVREEKIENINSYILERGTLDDGLYFYELRSLDSGLVATGKFVVE